LFGAEVGFVETKVSRGGWGVGGGLEREPKGVERVSWLTEGQDS
jgi:hypothetical protein